MKTLKEQIWESSSKHKEWSMILTDYISRPVALGLAKTPITPNQISILSLLFALAGCYFLLLGGTQNLIIGASLAMVYNVLDMTDGMIARVKNLGSTLGHWLDGTIGFVVTPLLIISLAIGQWNYLALVLGLFAAVSYPIQYVLIYFHKAEVVKKNDPIEVGGILGSLRYAYGISFFYVFLFIAALIGKPLWVLIFWATFGNLYWILIIFMQYRSLKNENI